MNLEPVGKIVTEGHGAEVQREERVNWMVRGVDFIGGTLGKEAAQMMDESELRHTSDEE
jgi:hypothetical protein